MIEALGVFLCKYVSLIVIEQLVGPWVKKRTYLGAVGMVHPGQIAVPQTLLIREYAYRIDIH